MSSKGSEGTVRRYSFFAARKLAPRLRPHVRALLGAGFCLIASAAIGLTFPLVVRYLMDAAFITRNLDNVNTIALALLGLFFAQGALNFGQVYLLGATGERVVAGLRVELFSHLLTLSPGFYTERSSGELTSRLASDVSMLQTMMTHQIAEMLRQGLYLIGGLGLLAFLHPKLMVTTAAVAPVVVLTGFLFGRYLHRRSVDVQDRIAAANASAEEALTQIPIVQSFVRENTERKRYGRNISRALRAALRRALARAIFFGVITFVTFAGIVAVLWEGGRLVLVNEITGGELVSFLLYSVTVAAAITALAAVWSGYKEAQGAAQRVFELMDIRPDVEDPIQPEMLIRETAGEIAFENVWFRYGPDEPWVLTDIDLRVGSGENVALVGPSGGGKSTLVSLVPRFWDPARGRILLHGTDLRRFRLHDLRSAIGIVPQEPMLFAGTVAENIAYGRSDATEDEIIEAARGAHAHDFILALAEGYETMVGERGIRLSGGQRQRIAIARILLKSPEILILDEATSSLDTESERLVEEALEVAMRGRTTIIIAHRLRTVQRADRLLVLEDGSIVEEGPHDELLERDGLYAQLYRGQLLAPAPSSSSSATMSVSSLS